MIKVERVCRILSISEKLGTLFFNKDSSEEIKVSVPVKKVVADNTGYRYLLRVTKEVCGTEYSIYIISASDRNISKSSLDKLLEEFVERFV